MPPASTPTALLSYIRNLNPHSTCVSRSSRSDLADLRHFNHPAANVRNFILTLHDPVLAETKPWSDIKKQEVLTGFKRINLLRTSLRVSPHLSSEDPHKQQTQTQITRILPQQTQQPESLLLQAIFQINSYPSSPITHHQNGPPKNPPPRSYRPRPLRLGFSLSIR